MRKAGLLLIGAALTLAVFVAPALAGTKVILCHATGSVTNPFVQEEVSENAVAQHLANHNDTVGPCPTTEVSPSPTTSTSTTSAPSVTTTTSVTEPPETTTTTTVPTSTTTTVTETESPSTSTEPPAVTTTTAAVLPTTTATAPVTSGVPPTQDPQPTMRDSRLDSESATKTANAQPKQALAFTGIEDVVPIGAAALVLLTTGSGLLWLSRRKDA